MPRIFISYRRGDSKWAAKALYNHLSDHFGEDQIFMDIDTIEPGVDFVWAIEDAVGSCGALIAVIGTGWLDSTDEHGRRRLYNPNDFVSLEIASALKRDICVIPALIDGATMPHASDLPPQLAMLSRRNALEISEKRFNYDVGRLIGALEKAVGGPSPARHGLSSAPPAYVAPEPALTFGGYGFVEVAALPGEKALWKEKGVYGIGGNLALRDIYVRIVLTNQRLLIIPPEKPDRNPWVRPKKVFEILPLAIKHADIMRVSTKPLDYLIYLRPVTEIALVDGTIHKILMDTTKDRRQDIQNIIGRR